MCGDKREMGRRKRRAVFVGLRSSVAPRRGGFWPGEPWVETHGYLQTPLRGEARLSAVERLRILMARHGRTTERCLIAQENGICRDCGQASLRDAGVLGWAIRGSKLAVRLSW